MNLFTSFLFFFIFTSSILLSSHISYSFASTSELCSSSPPSNVHIITPNFMSCRNASSSPPAILRIGASSSAYFKDVFYSPSLQMLNGWKMFIEWVNYERHGIALNNQTYLLEFIFIEDYSSLETVIDITEYLIQTYQVNFMFAPYSTLLTAACASITENQNITLFSSGAPLPGVFENTEYVYGLLPAASTYSEGAFHAFSVLGARSIAVISDYDVTVCNENSSILFANLYNLTLYGFYSVNSSEVSYNQTIKEILVELKDNNVETVFGCSFSTLCEVIITYAKQIDYNPFGIMLSLCIINPSLLALGDDLSYVFALAPWASTSKIHDQYTNWTAADFETRYETTYGSIPTYLSAASFASGEILLASLEATNSLNSTVLQQSLLNPASFYPTLYGNISFNSIGQSRNDMFVVQIQPSTQHLEIVLPPSYAEISPYFPVPSWSQRQCEIDTNYCSSHGNCSSTGVCVCDYGYYGFENINSCDTYCVGTFDPDTGGCAKFTTYYVGVLLDYQFPEFSEYLAHISLAADMVNNKTDGWFDEILNVHLVLNVSDSACDYSAAIAASDKLNHWAESVNQKNPLNGMIGSYCSSASAGAAIYNNEYAITQVSYASTSEGLSDKDLYEFFTRTCGSDSAQGPALAKTLQSLGIVPFIAVVHTDDDYSVSLSNSFSTSYESSDGMILLSYSYNIDTATTATYNSMMDELAKSGAPVILLVVYQDQIEPIFNAASNHPVLSSTEILWIGADAWTDVAVHTPNLPSGTIGLAPNHFNGNITDRYLEVWKNLNPTEYPDSNGNRNDVSTYSLQAADAVFALANAYEISLHDNTGLTGTSLRTYIFSALIGQVSFEGVSGTIDFSASGDLVDPIFRIVRYEGYELDDEQWEDVGTIDSNGLSDIDLTKLVWPDGSVGVTSSYSNQLVPYCGAGQEPIMASGGIYTCTPCEVGYYKPSAGRESCMTCPEGADCNDVGITIPCILKGYWRAQPPNPIDLSNFKKYPIYICDFSIVCHGGCQLNQTCQHDRKQSSPVCGVCEDGYYMSDGVCYACSSNQSGNQTFQTIVYTLVAFGSLFLLFSVLVFTITFNLASTRTSITSSASADHDNPCSSSSLSDIPEEDMPSEIHDQDNDDRYSNTNTNTSRQSRSHSQPPRKSTLTKDFRRKSLATIQTMTRSVSKSIFTPAIALLTHQENQRKVKKVIKGSGMTAKITLSFLQVMTGSFYMLNLDFPSYFKVFFNAIRINPFRPIQASFSCDNQSSNYLLHPFYVGTIFCVLIPFIFILFLFIAAFFAWKVFGWTRHGHDATVIEKKRQWKRLRDLTVKIYFWFCLISYPPLSQRILSFFNCRNLGLTGTYLRADYTVSCESNSYQLFFFVAMFGTLLVPVGVPVLFSFVVHYRKHPLLLNPTLLLHDNFVTEWRYFEAYDLIRKLTLTSLVVYVAPPDTASQCLFLLLVDGTALLLLAYSRPYANSNDDFLSGVLVSIECISFFVATVVVSGIASQDHYNLNSLYNTLFALILFSMACIVPWTLALKFKAVSTRVDRILDLLMQKSEDYGLPLPALTRLDSRRRMQHEVEEIKETMHDIRSSLSDLAHIELMYRDADEDDDEEDRNGGYSAAGITTTGRPWSTSSTNSNSSVNGSSVAKNPIHSTSLTKNPKEILMIKKRDSERRRALQSPSSHDLEMVRESDENSSNASSVFQEFLPNETSFPTHLPPIPSTPSSSSHSSSSSSSPSSASFYSQSNPPPLPKFAPPAPQHQHQLDEAENFHL